ncbi:hypothetical protein V8E36_002093 [Tilletia maclaganii]
MAKQREAERVQHALRRAQHKDAETQAAESATSAAPPAAAQQPDPADTEVHSDALAAANAHAQAAGNPPVKTSATHPINISSLIPPHLLPIISESIFAGAEQQPSSATAEQGASTGADPFEAEATAAAPTGLPQSSGGDWALTDGPPPPLSSATTTTPPQRPQTTPTKRTIGNLLLSSCPGKKVRLTGPVRGRGAICRSLSSDLGRMRALGIHALVCCLDDDELAFLGAPWSEYAQVAREAGLEVVRIPIAEGFAPSSVRELDERVGGVIERWSMRGMDVLVHCRGGVGRAGLFACAWMLKMGLVREPLLGSSAVGAGELVPGSVIAKEAAGPSSQAAAGMHAATAPSSESSRTTPPRVRNGTATPAATTSPFLFGADEGEFGGMLAAPPTLLLSDPADWVDEDLGGAGDHDPQGSAATVPNVASGVAAVVASSGGDEEDEQEHEPEGDSAEQDARGRTPVPSLKSISRVVESGAAAAGGGGGAPANRPAPPATSERERALLAKQDVVLRTVERLIRTIRTRRSPKAIETAEQVKFLVDYVTFLENAPPSTGTSVSTAPPVQLSTLLSTTPGQPANNMDLS